MKLSLPPFKESSFKILCLGAHSDDIEIGCGGTILRLLKEYNAEIYWIVFGAGNERAGEASQSANLFIQSAKQKKITINSFRESFFPYVGIKIKEYFEDLKQEYSPDLIFSHYRNDLHQDHRLISELTWNTFRDHMILEYEVLKYDGDLGTPNLFVHLDDDICRKKIEYICTNFKSQQTKSWFTADTFLSMLRIRGVESNAPGKYAEAFYCRKMIF